MTVLLEQRVLRFGQHASQLFFVELTQGRDDRQAANQLGDNAVVRQVLGHNLVERVLYGAAQFSAETDAAGTHAGCDAVVDIIEGASHDEENVRGINLNIRVRRVLASALRRYGRHGALNNLQQRLLHALTGHVTGDGEVLAALAGNLVDLVNVDDAALSLSNIAVSGIDEAQQNVLHVVTHVARLGEGGCVDQGEGHIQLLRQGCRQVSFTAASRAEHQNIRLAQLHLLPRGRRKNAGGQHRVINIVDALVVVVHRHRQGALRRVLTDDVVVEVAVNFARSSQLRCSRRRGGFHLQTLFSENLFAQLHTFVADGNIRAEHNLENLRASLLAEGASHAGVGLFGRHNDVCGHEDSLSIGVVKSVQKGQ